MSASLVELVVAIALAGVLLAGALIPVTQTVHDYQQAEAAVERGSDHALAGVRIEQVAGAIWRYADAPSDFGALSEAAPGKLAVGSWEIDEAKGELRQGEGARKAAVLAGDVDSLAFSYRVDGGSWAKSVAAKDFDTLRAVRFAWDDGQSGASYFGVIAPADMTFVGQLLELPAVAAPAPTYERKDYERAVTLTVKPWK